MPLQLNLKNLLSSCPDSWSSRSSSSRDGGLPQTDPVTWVKRELESEERDRSPISSKDISSSLVEEPETYTVTGNNGAEDIAPLQVPIAVPNKPSTPAVTKPKGKVRAAFSESQMNTLVQRFRVQRYLTPAEMKNLAEMTGLTYQQVRCPKSSLGHRCITIACMYPSDQLGPSSL